MEDVLKFIQRNTRHAIHVEGTKHAESYEFPPAAIREAVINALVHADYAHTDHVLVTHARLDPGRLITEQPLMRLWRTLRRMKTAVLLPLSVSASESGSQSRSLSVFGARHDLSGSITIADCGCDADSDTDPDRLLF